MDRIQRVRDADADPGRVLIRATRRATQHGGSHETEAPGTGVCSDGSAPDSAGRLPLGRDRRGQCHLQLLQL